MCVLTSLRAGVGRIALQQLLHQSYLCGVLWIDIFTIAVRGVCKKVAAVRSRKEHVLAQWRCMSNCYLFEEMLAQWRCMSHALPLRRELLSGAVCDQWRCMMVFGYAHRRCMCFIVAACRVEGSPTTCTATQWRWGGSGCLHTCMCACMHACIDSKAFKSA